MANEMKNLSYEILASYEQRAADKELTLEEKILNYINQRKSGTRVSDMEVPLGDTRMKIGFVAKKLLDAGLVQKVDNFYYPLE